MVMGTLIVREYTNVLLNTFNFTISTLFDFYK